jgi:gas vesicle protein
MRFIIGLLLGLGIGLAGALLLAPEKGRWQREEEARGEEGFGENHDTMAGLRRAMRGLQEQVQEAWQEARQAAEEAEREMRARYGRAVSKRER